MCFVTDTRLGIEFGGEGICYACRLHENRFKKEGLY